MAGEEASRQHSCFVEGVDEKTPHPGFLPGRARSYFILPNQMRENDAFPIETICLTQPVLEISHPCLDKNITTSRAYLAFLL